MLSIQKIPLFLAIAALCTSCFDKNENKREKEEDPQPIQSTLTTKVFKNLEADINSKGKYTLFSFSGNDTIPNSDSTTTKWDIAFNNTTIIINSGISGPGSATGQIITGIYDDMTEAPADGYKSDQIKGKAISTGSGNGWYNYNATNHIISPIPGRTLVFRTSDGKYVKIEILSYYKDMPTAPVNTDPARYYSFRYTYQADGSRNFK